MQAMVGIGIFICTNVLRRTLTICAELMRNITIETSAANRHGVPGADSHLNSNIAASGSSLSGFLHISEDRETSSCRPGIVTLYKNLIGPLDLRNSVRSSSLI